jgi:hypothetical protein
MVHITSIFWFGLITIELLLCLILELVIHLLLLAVILLDRARAGQSVG